MPARALLRNGNFSSIHWPSQFDWLKLWLKETFPLQNSETPMIHLLQTMMDAGRAGGKLTIWSNCSQQCSLYVIESLILNENAIEKHDETPNIQVNRPLTVKIPCKVFKVMSSTVGLIFSSRCCFLRSNLTVYDCACPQNVFQILWECWKNTPSVFSFPMNFTWSSNVALGQLQWKCGRRQWWPFRSIVVVSCWRNSWRKTSSSMIESIVQQQPGFITRIFGAV